MRCVVMFVTAVCFLLRFFLRRPTTTKKIFSRFMTMQGKQILLSKSWWNPERKLGLNHAFSELNKDRISNKPFKKLYRNCTD